MKLSAKTEIIVKRQSHPGASISNCFAPLRFSALDCSVHTLFKHSTLKLTLFYTREHHLLQTLREHPIPAPLAKMSAPNASPVLAPSPVVSPPASTTDEIQVAPSDSRDLEMVNLDKSKFTGLVALAEINSGAQRVPSIGPDGMRTYTEEDAYHALGFSFPRWKKWAILTSVFIVQLSMNFNAAIYGTAIPGLTEQFGVTDVVAEYGQAVFLIAYALGCEFWAPWSEELGRKWVMQGSLFLVNIWQVPCALARSYGMLIGFRALGGLSSAGGSVALGIVADMFEPNEQQYAVAFVVLSSVAGSVVAPIAGGFIGTYLSWHWVFWISLIFGGVAQIIHLFVPETRSSILLDQHAKSLRKSGEDPLAQGPNERKGTLKQRISWKEGRKLMWRPYKMLLSEPIVAFLSLLSGFSDALIFTGLDSFGLVMSKWEFSRIQIGLSFIPLLIGYFIAYGIALLVYRQDRRTMRAGKPYPPEQRLWALLYLVPLEPIGLFFYGLSSFGPPQFHWIGPLINAGLIGIANFAIYQYTIDYMVASYGEYSASATGGNGFCRDFLAGLAAFYARKMFRDIEPGTKWTLPIPSWILCVIGLLLCIPVYVFYHKGPEYRKRSPFAQQLEAKRIARQDRRNEAISNSKDNSKQNSRETSRASSPVRGADAA